MNIITQRVDTQTTERKATKGTKATKVANKVLVFALAGTLGMMVQTPWAWGQQPLPSPPFESQLPVGWGPEIPRVQSSPVWGQPLQPLVGQDSVLCNSAQALQGYAMGHCRPPVIQISTTDLTISPTDRAFFGQVSDRRLAAEVAQLRTDQSAYFAQWTADQPVAINPPGWRGRVAAFPARIDCSVADGRALLLCSQ
uniref:Uncharacterized protein n=1 Tax=Cyanothece sp. (strain PCC 7425 / ATCC 29141) TaxID=395961 RepID=B8HQZ6_CYAP4